MREILPLINIETLSLYAIAFGIGMAAAGAELVTRYRDEPFLAIKNWPSVFYALFNGCIAMFTYTYFGFEKTGTETTPSFSQIPVLNAIIVGAGAMLILRSKLFTIRSENGNSTPFGPSIVVDAFLNVLDRQIDRKRASRRHQLIFDALKGIADFDRTVAYFQMSLLSFQNLSQREKADLAAIVSEYKNVQQWSTGLKTMAVGFAILTIAGEKNFGLFVDGLKQYLQIPITPQPPAMTPAQPYPQPEHPQPPVTPPAPPNP